MADEVGDSQKTRPIKAAITKTASNKRRFGGIRDNITSAMIALFGLSSKVK